MPDILNVAFSRPVDDLDQRKLDTIAEESGREARMSAWRLAVPGLNVYDILTGETSRAAMDEGSFIPGLIRQANLEQVPKDDNYFLTEAKLTKYMDGTDPDLITRFGDVQSEAEAQLVRIQNGQIMESRRRLESMGWAGTAARMGASILAPEQLALGLATGGLGTVASTGTRMSRLAGMARAGFYAGAPFAAVEGLKKLDNPQIAGADIATAFTSGFGFGVGGVLGQGMGRAGRFAVGGSSAAIGAAVSEVPRSVFDQDRSSDDLMYAVGQQLIFGGVMHAIPATQSQAMNRNLARAAARSNARTEMADIASSIDAPTNTKGAVTTIDLSSTLSEKGQHNFAARMAETSIDPAAALHWQESTGFDAVDSDLSPNMLEQWHQAMNGMHPEDAAAATKSFAQQLREASQEVSGKGDLGSFGAASQKYIQAMQDMGPVAPEPAGKEALDFSLRNLTAANSTMSKVLRWKYSAEKSFDIGLTRWSMPGMVGQSEIPSFLRTLNAVSKDVLRKSDGSIITSAPEWASARFSAHIGKVEPMNDAVYVKHIKAQRAIGQKPLDRDSFFKEVEFAKRKLFRGADPSTIDPHVLEAAKRNGEGHGELFAMSQRHGVDGSEMFEHDPNHYTVIWDRSKLNDFSHFNEAEIIEAMAAAISKDQPELTPLQAARVAKMVHTKAGLNDTNSEFRRSNFLTEATREELMQSLRELNADAAPEDIAAIVKIVKNAEPTGGEARFKRRTEMDHTHVHEFADGRKLAISDLLENNSEILERHYADHMIRSSAMAEVFRAVTPGGEGATPAKSVSGLVDALRKNAEDLGFKPNEYTTDLKKLEVMLKMAAGIPLTDHDAGAVRTFRAIRNMNIFSSLSGAGSGVQNFSEFPAAIADAGFAAYMKRVPAAGEMFARAADGQMVSGLQRELQNITGLGMERITRRVMPRMANEDGNFSSSGKIDMFTAKAARFATDASLISPGQSYMQRSLIETIAQRWLDSGLSGKHLSDNRLAGMGLDRAMATRIGNLMAKYATAEKGWAGKRLVAVNLESWAREAGGIEAAAAWSKALTREATRQIMVNDPSQYAMWMTTELGKVFSQLRTFAFGAWESKLLYGIQQRDLHTLKTVGVATIAAGMMYMLRTQIDSVGRPDRQKYLRERLAPSEIAKASFSRAAYSSLIPTAVDTVVSDFGSRKQVFGQARPTDLSGGALLGNPTMNWVYKGLPGTFRAAQAPFFDDYDLSQKDIRNIKSGLWLPQFFGLKQGIEQMSKNLPYQSIEQE